MNPLVSIVLPTYNGERFIRESVQSILDQTFTNWELILVDDCSTDKTLSILRQFERLDPRIHVIHNEKNQKLPTALNIGFKVSRGEFVTWTSDDNMYHKKALEVMYKELEENINICMVCAEMIEIDENGIEVKKTEFYNKNDILFFNNVGACFMYRREVLSRVGLYDEKLFLVEDYDYWLRVIEYYGEIRRICSPLYYYRRHKNSLTQTKKEIIQNQFLKLKSKHIKILLYKYRHDPSLICRLYFDYIECGGEADKIEEQVCKVLPQLKYNRKKLKGNKIIIFGAGEIGSQALKLLKNKAIAFADNNLEKVGTYKDGLPIISFEEMINKNVQIMVAVSSRYIYELLMQLDLNNISEYNIFQYWIKNKI